jgi:predicted dehydrogenase
MAQTLSRRKVLKNLAALPLFSIVPRHVLGRGFLAPSDRLGLGFIGCGRQAGGLLNNFMKTNEVVVRAASEVYQKKADRFVELHRKNSPDGKPATELQLYKNYRELLDRKDIDAVIIATPDHWHAVQAVEALQRGKDVYCEKPLTLTVAEGRAVAQAVEKHKRVFQTGSMQRSWENFRKACELIRNGYLGEIKEVLVGVGSSPTPVDFKEEPIPAGLDWAMWLGPNPDHFYNNVLAPDIPETFWAKWRYYQGFGGGDMSDWGAHMFDIAQWALNMDRSGPVELTPPTAPANEGLVYRYDNGVTMKHQSFGRGKAVRFIGTEGQIDISRSFFDVPEKLKNLTLKSSDVKLPAPVNHYVDFLNAIRTRQQPIADAETGHRTATVCNISNIAYQLRRPLRWNPKKEQFKNDKEANALLSRQLREPYAIMG